MANHPACRVFSPCKAPYNPAVPMLPDPDQIASLIARSDERDLWHTYAELAFRLGYAATFGTGFSAGWRAHEAREAAEWRAISEPLAHPERGAAQRIRNAEAYTKRVAGEHERSFVTRAYATHPSMRTDVQAATVLSYAPP